ncbi:Dot/Icm T4SS effector metaeffector MesI [Legionella nagasakiensis]|uniref:Dot/Icm T4SS effector metaeffector MesI n=1 Tax=Legionella nagasakiensis TaxID=535290 RepID=UPI00105469C4|nr:Dot/Icm T4SS effector metaeffector MesI [Legionella nagasakiensis]
MPFFREKQFKAVDDLLTKEDYPTAIALMQRWPPANWALFQLQYPAHTSKLQQAEFEDFWQDCRDKLRLPGHPDFRFQKQADLSDADFVSGYVFYLLALNNKEDREKYQTYMQHAISHKSVHALQALMHDLIIQESAAKEQYYELLSQAVLTMENMVKHHGTAGYLLLAKGYLRLAMIASESDGETQARSSAVFIFVLKTLYLARFAEEDSAADVHNAFFGRGISKGAPFGFERIDDMIDKCRDLLGDSLPRPMQEFIRTQAKNTYEQHRRHVEPSHRVTAGSA